VRGESRAFPCLKHNDSVAEKLFHPHPFRRLSVVVSNVRFDRHGPRDICTFATISNVMGGGQNQIGLYQDSGSMELVMCFISHLEFDDGYGNPSAIFPMRGLSSLTPMILIRIFVFGLVYMKVEVSLDRWFKHRPSGSELPGLQLPRVHCHDVVWV